MTHAKKPAEGANVSRKEREMDRYIDFTDCRRDFYKGYRGANGHKISVIYNGERYMLKFPSFYQGKMTNSHICEYIGCHIFESLGIPAQSTLIGIYRDRPVVACKDFETGNKRLLEFAMLKNSIITCPSGGYETEVADIAETIEKQKIYPVQKLKEYFWDMYITDALIGNFDRHNGNWGLLTDSVSSTAELAPVYDCGSSLCARQTEETMKEILKSPEEIRRRVYIFPTSAIKSDQKKTNYFEYISSLENPDCTAALKRIYPRLDIEKLRKIIDDTPCLSKTERDFYKEILEQRKEKILDFAMESIRERH